MSAPSLLPVWDSTGVNVSATTPTHQTIGYANDEIPTAAELNYLLALYCAWITYLNSALSAEVAALASYSTVRALRLADVMSQTGAMPTEAQVGGSPTRPVVSFAPASGATAFLDLSPTPTTDMLVGFVVEVFAFTGTPVLAVYEVNENAGSAAGFIEPVLVAEKTITTTGMIAMTVAASAVANAFALFVTAPGTSHLQLGSVHMSWTRPTP